MTGRLIVDPLPPTHALRVNDNVMAPAYRIGSWLGVRPGNRPLVGRDRIFTHRRNGSTTTGRVISCAADHWTIRQWNPLRYRRLARSTWRATWRVRHIHFADEVGDAWHKARALGDDARVEEILRAEHGKCPMPPPLPADLVPPTIYALRGRF